MDNCIKCGVELTDANWYQRNREKRYRICNDCKKAYDREYYQKHIDTARQRTKEWRQNNLERSNRNARNYHNRNLQRLHKYLKERRARFRDLVLKHYSNGTMSCVRCGFSDSRALSIDHINGGGTQHRKKLQSGGNFNEMLVRANYPEGYQVLCMNCQFIKRTTDLKV